MFLLHDIPRVILSHRMVPSVKENYFYIFEEQIIFCKWHRLFAIAYWRDGKKSVIATFEKSYPSLAYSCLLDLNGDNLKVIRQALQEDKSKFVRGKFIGMFLYVYLKYSQKDRI